MEKLNKPKGQLQEVLYFLITKDRISFRQMFFDTGILNLSARLSDLKHEHSLPIEMKLKETTNKFGRVINYGTWSLLDKLQGIKIYKELNER